MKNTSSKKTRTKIPKITHWSFGLVNGKLAEIYFNKAKPITHCCVKQETYPTRKEQNWIKREVKLFRYTYRQEKYHLPVRND